jgi:endonuclease/exonuclease/phosphatase family metal-dependent hydrolase
MTSGTRRICLAGMSFAVAMCAIGSGASATIASRVSPKNRLMIVTANVQEGFNQADLRNMSEMKVFAKRVLNLVRYRPDVVLLQEVNSKSAHYIAKQFSTRTGQHYSVVADAGVKAFRETPKKVIKADTAILINTKTMAKTGPSGFIVTRYNRPGSKVELKHNARAIVSERGSNISLALVSVHVPGGHIAKRSKRLAKKLHKAYPSSRPLQFEVLGGDFNKVGPHYVSYGHVSTAHFWDVLTKGFHYVDSSYNVMEAKSSDYIFVRGGLWDAGFDKGYNTHQSQTSSTFYSDHQFRWAIVGPDGQPPTIPSGLSETSRASGTPRMTVTWNASSDKAGIADYDVYRSTDGTNFNKVGATQNLVYYDSQVDRSNQYWYRIVARDFSNDRSAPSNEVSHRA